MRYRSTSHHERVHTHTHWLHIAGAYIAFGVCMLESAAASGYDRFEWHTHATHAKHTHFYTWKIRLTVCIFTYFIFSVSFCSLFYQFIECAYYFWRRQWWRRRWLFLHFMIASIRSIPKPIRPEALNRVGCINIIIFFFVSPLSSSSPLSFASNSFLHKTIIYLQTGLQRYICVIHTHTKRYAESSMMWSYMHGERQKYE